MSQFCGLSSLVVVPGGFESPDSDFDVRFIYKHKEDFYLRLNDQRDIIELPIDDTWDVNGWDLDKTLKLLYKSNPTLFEWLQSPIVYQQTDFIERIHPLANQYFSEKKMLYHYLNTTRTQINKYLSGDKVRPKKYFYALRPIWLVVGLKNTILFRLFYLMIWSKNYFRPKCRSMFQNC